VERAVGRGCEPVTPEEALASIRRLAEEDARRDA
jgi:hypothetical protein